MTDPLYAYLLLDTSASMTGAPLEALKQGLGLLCGTFIARSKRPIQICLVGFESTSQEIGALSDINGYEIPPLEAAGSSSLGRAFRLVATQLPEHDPTLVYVFTDGDPTDDWEVAIELLRPRVHKIFGITCGIGATENILAPAFDQLFRVRDLTSDLLFGTFRSFV
jgi:uncharacterized protein YegL